MFHFLSNHLIRFSSSSPATLGHPLRRINTSIPLRSTPINPLIDFAITTYSSTSPLSLIYNWFNSTITIVRFDIQAHT
eukprot:jgi/Psemu1/314844/fgenesh1_kg.1727_\